MTETDSAPTSTSTPATSSSATETGNEPSVQEIIKYDTEELIHFLRKDASLRFNDEDGNIFRKERITGRDFLKITKDEYRSYGIAGGPAVRFADFAKECSEKKLRALNEVLEKYHLDPDGIDSIPLFTPLNFPA
jgi:hypothetical protein